MLKLNKAAEPVDDCQRALLLYWISSLLAGFERVSCFIYAFFRAVGKIIYL